VLTFADLATNAALPPETFRFAPPPGVQVLKP
jgi:outer membrane lipoprotein-sorting protein